MDQKIAKILNELEEIKDHFALYWNVPSTTGKFLNMLIKLTKAKKVLEIGSSNGYSGIYLAEALSHNKGMLYTVESHKKRFMLATENFKKSGLDPFIQQIFGHAPEILIGLKEKFDFAFLDATKWEYKSYMEVLLPKIKKGGFILADNAISHGDEMSDFIKFVSQNSQLESILLPFDNGLMLSYKHS